jgi:CheY-like chemotaxis protein
MPDGGTITIRVGEPSRADTEIVSAQPGADQSYALLTVSDTGPGMSDEVRARLFEPFFTTKSGQHGTGLGLANVYAIVQRCRGYIEVSSEPGAGSTFRIFLPRCQGPTGQYAEDVGPAADAADRETVLVVGHTDASRQEMATILERASYHVLMARNGEDALKLVDAHDGLLDLAVIDLHTPGIKGLQVADLLLMRDQETKLLFVSGDDPAELQRKGLLARDAALLHTPFVPDALLARVHSALQVHPEPVEERDIGD